MYITASSSAFGTIPKFTKVVSFSCSQLNHNEIKREKDIIKIDQRWLKKTFCINFKKTEIDLEFLDSKRREKISFGAPKASFLSIKCEKIKKKILLRSIKISKKLEIENFLYKF